MSSGKGNAEKTRYWQRTIQEAVRNGMSIREFSRQRRLKESQFYWWQHKLKASGQERMRRGDGNPGAASFALVSDCENAQSEMLRYDQDDRCGAFSRSL